MNSRPPPVASWRATTIQSYSSRRSSCWTPRPTRPAAALCSTPTPWTHRATRLSIGGRFRPAGSFWQSRSQRTAARTAACMFSGSPMGTEVESIIPRVQYPTGGGSVAWTPDSSAFWYTRYPGPEAPVTDQHYNVQVYFHRLGRAWTADPPGAGRQGRLGAHLGSLSEQRQRPALRPSPWWPAAMAEPSPTTSCGRMLRPSGWRTIQTRSSRRSWGPDDAIYGVSHAGAPNGKIVKLAGPATPGGLARAPTIVPEDPRASIRTDGLTSDIPSIVLTRDRLFLRELAGGPTRVRVFDRDGRPGGRHPPCRRSPTSGRWTPWPTDRSSSASRPT